MKNMNIRKSTTDDIDRILEIYADAREFMKTTGNPIQWNSGYPLKSLILQDMDNDKTYVCIKDGLIVGTFYYEEGKEPSYNEIFDGHWINNNPYRVVHRIASAKETKGVGSFCLDWCYDKVSCDISY